jgi:hypothetical protein
LFDLEVMAAAAKDHAGEQRMFTGLGNLQLSIEIREAITGIELIVLLEITDDVLRLIGPQHLCHAGLRPLSIDTAVAVLAGLRTCIARKLCGGSLSLDRRRRENRALLLFNVAQEGFESALCSRLLRFVNDHQLFACAGREVTAPPVDSGELRSRARPLL